MHRTRSTKIIATLGPSASLPARIEALFQAGADVFRLNFSHGHHEVHKRILNIIRDAELKYRHPIGILMDLQGSKLHLGVFAAGGVRFMAGMPFQLDLTPEAGDICRASLLPYPWINSAVS